MLMADQMASHYQIIEKIGAGGMGVVYKALDTKLNRYVALKVVPAEALSDPQANDRLIQEARAGAALNHPNICTTYEFGEADDGQTFIAMELIEGNTLKDLIATESLDQSKVADYALQLVSGLQEAHEHQIVHRDIKSANIMVNEKGLVKIMDFGLAKLAGRAQITKTGTTVGTAAYMSPEQARGEELGPQSDIFSLGVVIYEMLTGRLPFKGEYEAAIAYSILNSPAEPLDIDGPNASHWQLVLGRAMEKDLSLRYQSHVDIAIDVQSILDNRPLLDDRAVLREPASVPRSGRNKMAIGIIATVVLLVAAYASFGGAGNIFESRAAVVDDPLLVPKEPLPFALVLAPFWGPTDEALDEGKVMHALVERAVREELGEDEEVTIISTGITELPRSHADAEALAEQLGATMVIWGEVLTLLGEVEIQPYLTVSKSFGRRQELTSAGLVASVDQPNQISLRKSTADDVKDMALMSAARYYTVKEPARALTMLDKVTEPTAASLRLRVGIVDGVLNRLDEAERIYEKIVEIDPDNLQSFIQMGSIYTRQGKMELAEAEFEKALNIDPCDHKVLTPMSAHYVRKGEPERAESFLKDSVMSCPNNYAPHSVLSSIYAFLRKWDEAREEGAIAVELAPESGDAQYVLGWAYEFSDSLKLATHHYNEAIRLEKEFVVEASPHFGLGRVYTKLDRYNDAINEFRKALELSPTSSHYYTSLYSAYVEAGKPEKAKQVSDMALAQNPNNSVFHKRMAGQFSRQNEPELALAYHRNVLQIDSTDGTTYNSIGLLYEAADSLDLALKNFGIAAKKFPLDSWPHSYMARVFGKQGEYEKGIQKYEDQMALIPPSWDEDRSNIHSGIAGFLRALNRHEEAIEHYEQSISLNSRNASAFIGLQSAYERLGQYDNAQSAIDRYRTALPDAWRPLQTLGLFQYRRGKYSGAANTVKMLIDQERGDSWTNYQYVWYYLSLYRAGEFEKAGTYLAAVADSLKEDSWSASLVRYYAGELSESDLLKAAEDESPKLSNENLCEAYYYIGASYLLGLGNANLPEPDLETARSFFQKSLETNLSTFFEYQLAEAELQHLSGE